MFEDNQLELNVVIGMNLVKANPGQNNNPPIHQQDGAYPIFRSLPHKSTLPSPSTAVSHNRMTPRSYKVI